MNYYVKQTLKMVESNYKDDLNIFDIAEKLRVSKSYLSMKFKVETGTTFVDYLNKYRINQAIKLLDQGNMLISEVASEAGFNQYKNFSKVFKKHIGMTTSDFLKLNIKVVPKNKDSR